VRLDIPARTLTLEIDNAERAKRWEEWTAPDRPHQTPWQELYRSHVGQLETGGCLEFATKYQRVGETLARDNH